MAGIRFVTSSLSGCQLATAVYSWTINGGALTNGVLLVGMAGLTLTGAVSGITVNGAALTLVAAVSNGLADAEVWYKASPPNGLLTIEVTMNGAVDSVAVAHLYEGVNTASPIEASATATGTDTPATVNVTTLTPQAVVVDSLATSNKTLAVGAGQVSRANQVCTAGSGASSEEGPVAVPAATTMSWTGVDVLDVWATVAVVLRPFYELRAMAVM